MQPVLIYASETWPLTKDDEKQLCIFESKILISIFGPVEENGVWRKRYNHELYNLFKEPDIVKLIKIRRLEWAGHLLRASDQRTMKKVFKTMPERTRKVGRPEMRWEDCVRQDIRTLGIRNWRSVALNRQE